MTALLLFLESSRRAEGMKALAVADPQGVLIAGAGSSRTCEYIAALAPFGARALPANDVVPTRLEVIADARIRRIRVDGIELLLCASPRLASGEECLGSISEGVQRILGTSRKAPRGAR